MIKTLKKGDSAYLVAPSFPIENKREFYKGIEIIKNWGLKVHQNESIYKKHGYFAGDDNCRFFDIERAQKSELIICARGGWGASRVLEKNPNWGDGWMLGFSDACSLLLSKYSKGKLGSIHGPMISTLPNEPIWSVNRLKNLLFKGYVDDIKGFSLKKGVAFGEIIVTNLTIICFLIGTNHLPNMEGKILIFEDTNEELYKIDRMLTYLRMSKRIDKITGLAFGNFFNKKNIKEQLLLEDLILERFKEFNIPIVSKLPIGHIQGNAAIPIGFKGCLNGNEGNLTIDLLLN
tara:strand:- start:3438 stop:4307 length:870 start_codon:yes stop_codon:yes gene_type:complete